MGTRKIVLSVFVTLLIVVVVGTGIYFSIKHAQKTTLIERHGNVVVIKEKDSSARRVMKDIGAGLRVADTLLNLGPKKTKIVSVEKHFYPAVVHNKPIIIHHPMTQRVKKQFTTKAYKKFTTKVFKRFTTKAHKKFTTKSFKRFTTRKRIGRMTTRRRKGIFG